MKKKFWLKNLTCNTSIDVDFRYYHSQRSKLSKKYVQLNIVPPQRPTDGVEVHFPSIATNQYSSTEKYLLKNLTCNTSIDVNFKYYHSQRSKLSKKYVQLNIVPLQGPTDGVKVHFLSIVTDQYSSTVKHLLKNPTCSASCG